MQERPDLNDRAREVFRRLVEAYLETGEPVGSRALSRDFPEKVSPATIRNVMQDLEYHGLLASPHVSAGRIPTQSGLRLFVDGLMEIGNLDMEEQRRIEADMGMEDADLTARLDRAGQVLSGLTRGASLVLAPKSETPITHLEFVSLGPERALVVLVTADGQVENRVFQPPVGVTPSALREAANFLSAILQGRTLSEMRLVVAEEISKRRQELDVLAQSLIASGVAQWDHEESDEARLIVRGRANLLQSGVDPADLDRVRGLFDDLERKRDLVRLLDLTEGGAGVKVFIGSENKLFSLTGSSLVVSPYMDGSKKVIGAVGVIGPTRLNYGRIVPIVDYTAQLLGRLVSDGDWRG
ncbi:heat-inducible transcriptional repressor HrcA [Paracoccaceae bacterium GXU_MW_L88]